MNFTKRFHFLIYLLGFFNEISFASLNLKTLSLTNRALVKNRSFEGICHLPIEGVKLKNCLINRDGSFSLRISAFLTKYLKFINNYYIEC